MGAGQNKDEIDDLFDNLCDIFDRATKYEDVFWRAKETLVVIESPLGSGANLPSREVNKVGKIVTNCAIIDVNNCSESELMELPGISLVIAKKIVKFREDKRPFRSGDDFIRVMKVKPHHINRVKHMIRAGKVKMKEIKRAKEERILDI